MVTTVLLELVSRLAEGMEMKGRTRPRVDAAGKFKETEDAKTPFWSLIDTLRPLLRA